MNKEVKCSVCGKEVMSTKAFSRWNDYFCKTKCVKVRFDLEEEKEKEKEKDKTRNAVWSSCDIGGPAVC
jgi:endogenous inhibitor of DNA gyrase (YacG/DUF329 family)